MKITVQNVTKTLALVSVVLGLVAVAYPMPNLWKVYILATETVINGIAQYVSSNFVSAKTIS